MAPAAELAEEHRELAEIAALEDEERPDIAELLPVENFHPLLELIPGDAEILIAGEEDVAPALADHWQDVTAAFHDEDAHQLYVAPEQIDDALSGRARIRLSSIDQDQPFQFRAQTADIQARGAGPGGARAREADPLGLHDRGHVPAPGRGRAGGLQPRAAAGLAGWTARTAAPGGPATSHSRRLACRQGSSPRSSTSR